jgi:CheY-like chemotaxis protein
MEGQSMRTILIVDDSAFSRSRIRECLVGEQYHVTEADNGVLALGLARASPPQCMILDLLMPGMGGLEVMAQMREEGIAVPVVVLTADIQKTTASRCRELGAAAVLNKPCSREGLAEALKSALRGGAA